MTSLLKWLLVATALVLAGCTYEYGELSCGSDSDCPTGSSCTSGLCVDNGANNTNNTNNSNNANNVVITRVEITPATAALKIGEQVRLVATAFDANDTEVPTTFSWSSSANGIATVDSTGLTTGVESGAATITASAGGQSATAELTISTNVANVVVTPATSSLGIGVEQQFVATVTDANGTTIDRPVTWSVGDTALVSVDANGLARGLAVGMTEITATSDGVQGTASIEVVTVTIVSLELDPDMTTRVPIGGMQTIRAILKDEGGNTVRGETIEWSYLPVQGSLSIPPGQPDVVEYVAPAIETTVTVSAAYQGLMASVDLEVFIPVIQSVVVAPSNPMAYVGERIQMTATVMDELGNTVNNPPLSWFVDDTDIATIDPTTGELRVVGKGSVTVTGSAGGVDGTTVVTSEFQVNFIDGGLAHSCALAPNGAALCWGENDNGRLGTGSAANEPVPLLVDTDLLFAEIRAGEDYTCARSGNDIYCWGASDTGRLGISGSGDLATPGARVDGNELYIQVSVYSNHACGVTDQSDIYCWGEGTEGKLGNNVDVLERASPTKVADPAGQNNFKWKSVAAGGDHTCAIAQNDDTYCWGRGDDGQLGNNTTTDSLRPVSVDKSSIGNAQFASIASGHKVSCGITAAGVAYCWGQNNRGQVGNGSGTMEFSQPQLVAGSHTFSAISGGQEHMCGFTPTNEMYCWGRNNDGELGIGNGTDSSSPALVTGFSFSSVGVGRDHSCGIDGDIAYCWGKNTTNQLGDDSSTDRNSPVVVWP